MTPEVAKLLAAAKLALWELDITDERSQKASDALKEAIAEIGEIDNGAEEK
jgi:hypothetical protein